MSKDFQCPPQLRLDYAVADIHFRKRSIGRSGKTGGGNESADAGRDCYKFTAIGRGGDESVQQTLIFNERLYPHT